MVTNRKKVQFFTSVVNFFRPIYKLETFFLAFLEIQKNSFPIFLKVNEKCRFASVKLEIG